jgi:hypothetical protein
MADFPEENDDEYANLDVALETDDNQDGVLVQQNNYNYTPTGTKAPIYITKTGAFIKFEYLGDSLKAVKKVENYFTLTTKLITGQLKKIKSCKTDKAKKRIIVPRFGIFEILTDKFKLEDHPVKSQIKPGEKPETPFVWEGKQTSNQKLISDHITANYYTKERVVCGSAGLILNLEAGQGKSYLAAYMITKIQRKTAIILHSTSLIEQWVKVLNSALGDSVSIGYYYAKKKKLGDIMLMIIDSATSETFKFKTGDLPAMDFYNKFGFIIYDECHTYANKFSMKAMKIAHAPYMLGLSATPDENTMGFDNLVWWELGPVLNATSIPGYESTSEDFKATVHRIQYYGPPDYTKVLTSEATELTNTAGTINMICEDTIRNNVVIDCIKRGLDLGLYMFVFADRREYLETLRQLLQDTLKIEGEIVDDDKSFTTYPYMGTGRSIVKMNGLVLANPRKSKMKQYINRIFRLGSDETVERHIWDICDMKLKLSNQWNVRKKYYDSKGYKIESEKIKYNEYTGVDVNDIPETVTAETTEFKKLDQKKIKSIVSNIMDRLR